MGEADVTHLLAQFVGDPRMPGDTLYWARGFRQAHDPHSAQVFREATASAAAVPKAWLSRPGASSSSGRWE